ERERRNDLESSRIERARQLILAAEGSDWFWWFGDDFETENAADFDQLFRDHLIQAAELLGEKPPPRLHTALSQRAARQRFGNAEPPKAPISPPVDGRAASNAHWLAAGHFHPPRGSSAMARATRPIAAVQYGCDQQRLFLRIEPAAE